MIKPMLCRGHPEVFSDPDYIWETKYDGNRIIAVNSGQGYQLQARSGRDRTAQFPELNISTKQNAVLDGEIVCYDDNGRIDGTFNSIQRRNRMNNIGKAAEIYPATFEVFDILEAGGVNVEDMLLKERKCLLETVLRPSENVRLGHYTGDGISLFERAKTLGLEGVVGKRLYGRYLQDKREWLKVKVWKYGTFLVVGYTVGTGWRAPTFGALVLSDMSGNYAGEVGTGFNIQQLEEICGMFRPHPCPWPEPPVSAIWVEPFAARIRYLEYTNDGVLRFPSWRGLKSEA